HALAERDDRVLVANRQQLTVAPQAGRPIAERLPRQRPRHGVQVVAGVEDATTCRTDAVQLVGVLTPAAGRALEVRQAARRRRHAAERLADHGPPTIGTKRTGRTSRDSTPDGVRVRTRSCWSCVPTGTTSRPPGASCISSAGGTSGGAAVTTI